MLVTEPVLFPALPAAALSAIRPAARNESPELGRSELALELLRATEEAAFVATLAREEDFAMGRTGVMEAVVIVTAPFAAAVLLDIAPQQT